MNVEFVIYLFISWKKMFFFFFIIFDICAYIILQFCLFLDHVNLSCLDRQIYLYLGFLLLRFFPGNQR